MFKNLLNRFTGITFVILLIGNVLLSTVLYSVGITTGYEGEPSWSWDQYTETMEGLFGNLSSLFWLLVGIAFFVIMWRVATYFSKKGNHNAVGIWQLVGIVGGGAILYLLVDWSSFGFGFLPVIVLFVFTAIETLIFRVLANRQNP